MRFGDRLQVHMQIAPETLAARVPRLILQPLAENAIRHGLARHRRAGVIEISASRQNGELQLCVCDNGDGPNAGNGNDGIGLSNTRARLHTLYGAHGRFELTTRENGGAMATIVIPFTTAS
jgi:sensor histidine kinase YesM